MTEKVIVFLNGEGEVRTLSPAFGERLGVMETLPRIETEDVPEGQGFAAHKILREVAGGLREETDDEIVLRAAHCALPEGTSFALYSRDDIPAADPEGEVQWDAENIDWTGTSLGREAFSAAWTDAAAAIATTLAAERAAAIVEIEAANAELAEAWYLAHGPETPEPEQEQEPEGEGDAGDEGEGGEE